MVTLTLPEWLWITAFLGCFLFGGLCSAVFLFGLFGREEPEPEPERDTIPCPPPSHLPELWPRDNDPTRTKVSRTC